MTARARLEDSTRRFVEQRTATVAQLEAERAALSRGDDKSRAAALQALTRELAARHDQRQADNLRRVIVLLDDRIEREEARLASLPPRLRVLTGCR